MTMTLNRSRFRNVGSGTLILLGLVVGCTFKSESPEDATSDKSREASVRSPAQPLSELEPVDKNTRAFLASLHRSAVEWFVAAPGFGVRRMPLDIEDSLRPPSEYPASTNYLLKWKLGDITMTRQVDKQRVAANERGAHYPFQDMVDDKASRPAFIGSLRRIDSPNKESWALRSIRLVGLVKHPSPVVYLTDKVPGMNNTADVPTRELNAFEKHGLDALRSGNELKIARLAGNSIQMMGPLYSGHQCVSCHETKGQLLGAFSYELERLPEAKAEAETADFNR